MKKLKTFENFIKFEGFPTPNFLNAEDAYNLLNKQTKLSDHFKNSWAKDILVRNKIMTNPILFKKYSLYLKDFDWESLTDEELNHLWIEWSNDDNQY